MSNRNILITIAIAIVLIIIGHLFIDNSWLGYTESAILYLAAIVGAGCYWIGSNRTK